MMKLTVTYKLPLAVLLFGILFCLLWPLYIYIFDVDGVGYGLIAQHLAQGNIDRVINGFWSPLHPWLIAPFVKAGADVRTAFLVSNAFISIAVLLLLSKFMKQFVIHPVHETAVLFVSVILLLHFSYYELAADLLLLPFLLLYILQITRADFFTRIQPHLYCAVFATFAYFSKTYALPFLVIIHIALFVHHFFQTGKFQLLFLVSFLGLLSLLCLPWILLISNKYGLFTFGTSARLNVTWFLGGTINEKEFFRYPHYADSPGWWEDPYLMQDQFLTMFHSLDVLLKQFRVLLFNIQLLVKVLMNISVFAPAIILLILIRGWAKENGLWQKLLLFILLFPAGYLLTFIEGRYVWIFQFVLLIAGIHLLQDWLKQYPLKPVLRRMIFLLYYSSFLLEPLNVLKDTALDSNNRETFEMAAYLKQHIRTANFTSNKKSSEGQVMAFLSGKRHFFINRRNYTYNNLKEEMAKKDILVFLFYYEFEYEKEAAIQNLTSQNDFKYTELKKGLIVFTKNTVR